MPDRRIFSFRYLRHSRKRSDRILFFFSDLHSVYIKKSKFPHVRHRKIRTGCRSSYGITSRIAVSCRIRHFPDPNAVKYDQKYSLHVKVSIPVCENPAFQSSSLKKKAEHMSQPGPQCPKTSGNSVVFSIFKNIEKCNSISYPILKMRQL